jgi:DNA-binding protein Fis
VQIGRVIDELDEFFLTAKTGEIYTKIIGHVEKMLIEKALQNSFGNQILAAKILGINRNTMRTKIKRHNIEVGNFKR